MRYAQKLTLPGAADTTKNTETISSMLYDFQKPTGMVVPACNPSTQEAEAGGSQV
jgi:hypothetical protein